MKGFERTVEIVIFKGLFTRKNFLIHFLRKIFTNDFFFFFEIILPTFCHDLDVLLEKASKKFDIQLLNLKQNA